MGIVAIGRLWQCNEMDLTVLSVEALVRLGPGDTMSTEFVD
jgi:hypothetical protein